MLFCCTTVCRPLTARTGDRSHPLYDVREDADRSWLAVSVTSASCRHIWIQLESVLHKPEFNVGSAGAENVVLCVHFQSILQLTAVIRRATRARRSTCVADGGC